MQQMQTQLIQSEKMSALGNLVAGVAHEINNPLSFLNGSIRNAMENVQDLFEHIKLYQKEFSEPIDTISEHAEEIDLEYINQDLPKIFESMQKATHRITNISNSLRVFSRGDTEYKVKADLNEGIDSTILILKYRLQANKKRPAIEVLTNYGDLPQVKCFPGQLNLVFMNILANAIDALDESNTGLSFQEIEANYNQIIIKTYLEDNQVKVSIADNGQGIPEEVKQNIFDHLFTTKEVGQGTGLGLSIARQIIVEKHGGSLEVNSEIGKGTEFIITIPM